MAHPQASTPADPAWEGAPGELGAGACAGLPAPAERSDWAARGLLACALLVGALCFYRLGDWGLWVDEAFTVHDAHRLLRGEASFWRGNALGLAAIAGWVAWLGRWPSELDLRVLPALFGFAGIALTYWAFKSEVGRRRAAAAALLVAVSTWHLYWSQNARFYTLAQDLGLVTAGLFLRSMRTGSLAAAAGAAAAGALGVLAHLSGAWIPLALTAASWICLRGPGPWRRPRLALSAAGALLGACASPWILGLWRDYAAAQGGKAGSGAALDAMLHFALTTGYYVTPALASAALAGALLSLAALRAARREVPGKTAPCARFDGFATAVVLCVALGSALAASSTRVTAQYVFVLLPWIALLATRPLLLAHGRAAAFGWIYLAVLAAPALARQALYFNTFHGERERWREAYEHVWSVRAPGDLVIGMCPPVGEYYLSPGDSTTRVPDRIVRIDPWNSEAPLDWARLGRPAWIVLSREWLEDWERPDRGRFERFLGEQCRLALYLPLEVETRDLAVWVYRFDG